MDYYSRKEISNSHLSIFEISPSLYYNKVILGKDEDDEKKISKSMEDGKLIHAFIEDPNNFVIADVNKVDGMLGKFIELKANNMNDEEAYKICGFKVSLESVLNNFNKPENQQYYNYLQTTSNSDYVISSSTKKILNSCIYSLQNNQKVYSLLFTKELFWDVYNEQEIYWSYKLDEHTYIECKSKLDKIIIDYDRREIIIIDLKTTGNSIYGDFVKINNTGNINADYYASGFFKTNLLNYSLYRQAAFYKCAIQEWLTKEFKDKNFLEFTFKDYIVPVSTKYPYDCCVYHISDNIIRYGYNKINELMEEYLWCKQTGLWKKRNYYESIMVVN